MHPEKLPENWHKRDQVCSYKLFQTPRIWNNENKGWILLMTKEQSKMMLQNSTESMCLFLRSCCVVGSYNIKSFYSSRSKIRICTHTNGSKEHKYYKESIKRTQQVPQSRSSEASWGTALSAARLPRAASPGKCCSLWGFFMESCCTFPQHTSKK